jgi:cation diffusion facilitator CzcD-associated flavoprotein CzcO
VNREPSSTPVLVLGAGPFGLALSAYLRSRDRDHLVVGRPMAFWRSHMPSGMLLRSDCDWHLDPLNLDTLDAFAATRGLTRSEVEPLTLAFYLEYADWFMRRKGIEPVSAHVERLDRIDGRFTAVLDDGGRIEAGRVVLAVGFQYFKHVPSELSARLPEGRVSHTADLVDLAALAGKRVLIVGGRQSAFEWAALLHEQGAAEVHVVHRHPTPAFEPSDWSWVLSMVDGMVEDPGWYRRLSDTGREELNRRFWTEGRLRLEPWLAPRLVSPSIRLLPRTSVASCAGGGHGTLRVTLDDGRTLMVDHVVLATGYKVDVARIPFLAAGNLLDGLEIVDGSPALDDSFQSSVPGLYFTSMAATRSFGSFFAFTVSARASAAIIGRALIAAPI